MTPDRGPWIQTYTGRRFYYADPRPEDIHIEDIAHALGMQCRYAGHSYRFYSIAEHSKLVSQQFGEPQMRMIGLLHDATEAYCVDLPSPLKQLLPSYKEYENKVWSIIAVKFGLPEQPCPEIKEIDTRMMITERPQLFHHPLPWPKYDAVKPLKGVSVRGLDHYAAKAEFLDEFRSIQAIL